MTRATLRLPKSARQPQLISCWTSLPKLCLGKLGEGEEMLCTHQHMEYDYEVLL